MSNVAAETVRIDRISRLSLVFILLADLGLVAIYLLSVLVERLFGIPVTSTADLNLRYSLASTYNYSKFFIAAALLLALAFFHRRAGYVWLAALFLFFLVDDALEVHDKLAHSLGDWIEIGIMSSLSPQNRGEPLVYLGMLAITASLLFGARRSMRGAHHGVWLAFTLAVVALALFGAGIDMVHGVINAMTGDGTLASLLDTAFIVLEDGGEGIAASVIVWLALDGMLNAVRAGGKARVTPIMGSSPA